MQEEKAQTGEPGSDRRAPVPRKVSGETDAPHPAHLHLNGHCEEEQQESGSRALAATPQRAENGRLAASPAAAPVRARRDRHSNGHGKPEKSKLGGTEDELHSSSPGALPAEAKAQKQPKPRANGCVTQAAASLPSTDVIEPACTLK